MSAASLNGINKLLFVCGHHIEHSSGGIIVCLRVEAQGIFALLKSGYNDRLKDALTDATEPHKERPYLVLIPLCLPYVSLVALLRMTAEKANNMSAVLESKVMPHTSVTGPKFSSLAFQSSKVEGFLNYLDSYGGTDPIDFFPLYHLCAFFSDSQNLNS